MEYRKWYNKDIKTALLGFGAMRLKTINGEIDEEKGMALFDYAIKNGVNYFDTAMPYTDGKNEAFVGKALKKYPRESYYLATKLSPLNSKEDVLQLIDKQLETLQTDYIDMYLLHSLNKDRLQKVKDFGVIEIVKEWKRQGKIRNIGFSFHDDYNTFKEIIDLYDWDFCQIQLNYMDTEHQQGLQGYHDLVERKIPVIIMEPVKGGKLAAFNQELEKIFKDYSNSSVASWAFRWLGSFEGIHCILSGMNNEEQVIDNINTFTNFIPLNDDERQKISEVKHALIKKTEVNCTDCRYCLPCAVEIPIPSYFKLFNDYAMYKSEGDAKWFFQHLKNTSTLFTECIDCMKCVQDCPQNIDIPNELKRIEKELTFLK